MTALYLLELEYNKLRNSIDKFDDHRLKIKGWTVTASGALLALGAHLKEPMVIAAGIIAVIFFAYLEIIYMEMEACCIDRGNHIEELLELARRIGPGVDLDGYVFGIGKVSMAALPRPRLEGLGSAVWQCIPGDTGRRPGHTRRL
jgi:hypothetical protein